MDQLPEPLVPVDVDLRNFGYMPLDVLRLRDSDLAALATGDEFKAAVMLWCVAWHQVPAASLPDDDRLLARYSGAGSAWKKVKEAALRGFVKCSDGRLYHRTIAEKAIESWDSKVKQREKTRAATAAREAKRREQQIQRDVERDEQRDVPRDEQRDVERDVVQGKGSEQKGREGIVNPTPTPSPGESDLLGDPPRHTTPNPKPTAERGTRLPTDWVLPKPWGEWALSEIDGITPDEVRQLADEFRDYWCAVPGVKGRKIDWLATWRNSVRDRGPGVIRRRGSSPVQPVASVRAGAL